jgi:phage protein D
VSAAPIPIYEGQDFYVPTFQVKLAGRKPGDDVIRDIQEVSYKDDVEQVDSFEITINNWDADKLAFKYSDQDLFNPGKKVELWMGYYGQDSMRLMIQGEITSLRPNFPASGQPTLAISGLNVLHTLRKKQESHAYIGLKDSQIAKQIGGRLGVKVETDSNAEASEEKYDYLLQNNQYDIVFLIDRARHIGYDLFVKEQGANGSSRPSVLYFGPSPNLRQVVYKLTWGKSLIQFQPTLTTAKQVGTVVVRAWSVKEKKLIEATATRQSIQTKGVGAKGGEAQIEEAFNEREEIVVDHPVQSQKEAQTLAKETLERIAKDMVKGSGSTVGLPDLRAGSVMFLEKLGDRFSGRYFVTSTTHGMGDGGYTTQFECRREEVQG